MFAQPMEVMWTFFVFLFLFSWKWGFGLLGIRFILSSSWLVSSEQERRVKSVVNRGFTVR